MHQLRPTENFPIRRQLDDPLDSGTYYMRAVLRWADDGTVIPVNGAAFINMVSEGSQRFRANIQVPADKLGGLGSYLIITTSVYSDSGYTTFADNYRIEEETYLVFDRKNPYLGMGGGSGVNYETVRKLVREEIAARKQQKLPSFDSKPILEALNQVRKAISAIEIPKAKEISLEPILSRLGQTEASIKAAVDAIEIPTPDKIDLTPIVSRLDKMDPEIYQGKMDTLFNKVKDFLGNDMDTVKSSLDTIQTMLTGWGKHFSAILKAASSSDEENVDGQ